MMTIGEGRNIDWPINSDLWLSVLLFLDSTVNALLQPPINLMLHPNITCEDDAKILSPTLQGGVLHLWRGQTAFFPVGNHSFCLGGAIFIPVISYLTVNPRVNIREAGMMNSLGLSSANSWDNILWSTNQSPTCLWLLWQRASLVESNMHWKLVWPMVVLWLDSWVLWFPSVVGAHTLVFCLEKEGPPSESASPEALSLTATGCH